jgi:pentose-5-phosphate-3-epimerase
MDPIMVDNIRRLHEMVRAVGLEQQIEVMEDGGLGVGNVAEFVAAGMTVGEFSSPLLKGPHGKLQPGTGEIGAAVAAVRAALDAAAANCRDAGGE